MPIIACVGGFLGAGKTTAIAAAARELAARGKRVGVVTNDQGSRLVDTALLRDAGLPAEEVTGGCFCCRFDELVAGAERILDRARPDVIFAEAVGSCTDLAATVLRPLARYYADRFELSPLSVFVEPERLRAEALGLAGFPGSVAYLFEN
jgi:G3E family GTPase